ncbi:MAG TPA: SGNH/GDSL hydrolase family protein [Sphingobacteriaceae bacterium]
MRPVVRYLALGDSYTVGEAVDKELSFPFQLAGRLAGRAEVIPTVVARTGWTTDELLQGLEESGVSGTFDLVTLLIGVNNQYREYDLQAFRTEFSELLTRALGFAGGRKERVMVISIPDWGVTPFASGDKRSAAEIAAQIDRFNGICREVAGNAGIRFLSITEDSRRAASDPELTAADGLHPSGSMYGEWADRLAPWADDLI